MELPCKHCRLRGGYAHSSLTPPQLAALVSSILPPALAWKIAFYASEHPTAPGIKQLKFCSEPAEIQCWRVTMVHGSHLLVSSTFDMLRHSMIFTYHSTTGNPEPGRLKISGARALYWLAVLRHAEETETL